MKGRVFIILYSAILVASMALRGSSVESFLFRMGPAVNRDNRELVLSDFALCACEYVTLSRLQSISYWRRRRQKLSEVK